MSEDNRIIACAVFPIRKARFVDANKGHGRRFTLAARQAAGPARARNAILSTLPMGNMGKFGTSSKRFGTL